jgi:hypothetical protein
VKSDTTTILPRSGDVAHFDARGWLEVIIFDIAHIGVT